MPRRSLTLSTGTCFLTLVMACGAFAQQRTQAPAAGPAAEGRGGARAGGGRVTRAPLFFREEWKSQGAESPVNRTGGWSPNPELELTAYGEGNSITGDAAKTNPVHLWTATCDSPCAFTSATTRILPTCPVRLERRRHQHVRLSQGPPDCEAGGRDHAHRRS